MNATIRILDSRDLICVTHIVQYVTELETQRKDFFLGLFSRF